MSDLAAIVFGTALANNLFLEHALGGETAEGCSRRLDVARGLGMTLIILTPLVCLAGYSISVLLLIPAALESLMLPVMVILIFAVMVFIKQACLYLPDGKLKQMPVFFPLAGMNTAVIGSLLLSLDQAAGPFQALVYGFGCALGFALVLMLLTAMRLRLEALDIPSAFRGTPITLISAGLMAMAFMGFAGIFQG